MIDNKEDSHWHKGKFFFNEIINMAISPLVFLFCYHYSKSMDICIASLEHPVNMQHCKTCVLEGKKRINTPSYYNEEQNIQIPSESLKTKSPVIFTSNFHVKS